MNPHQEHPATPRALVSSLWSHRGLIDQLVRREVIGRYRGSILGVAWSFFNPILMLLVYTFVFSFVFQNRWGGGVGESHASFAVILFVGLIVHGLFAEVANRAPSLILNNVSYVKRVVFPLEVLPWVVMGSAIFHASISLLVLLLAQLMLAHHITWTLILFPLILAPLVMAVMGIAWFLASIGVYVRDVGQTIGIITTVMLFLAPIFYPISILPPRLQAFFYLNPLTFVIEEGRKVLLFGQMPNWWGWLLYSTISLSVAFAGFWWFQKTRKGFADVV
ncbi:sugar ABC transporter permease [Thiocapsa imhoffii]|uniref:Transport permease protein n=1 Tax=Thiocapsa imhoffii TaxID=382777 RepID=A0A9X0WHN0_9GAMM|nr:ABC transporter permease [Thiocapsa imhoffii]MBK1644894.1 sugar ABC transporter permease [Thiocapsa imhoffii]